MGAIDVEISIAIAMGKRRRKMGIDEKDIQVIEKDEENLTYTNCFQKLLSVFSKINRAVMIKLKVFNDVDSLR